MGKVNSKVQEDESEQENDQAYPTAQAAQAAQAGRPTTTELYRRMPSGISLASQGGSGRFNCKKRLAIPSMGKVNSKVQEDESDQENDQAYPTAQAAQAGRPTTTEWYRRMPPGRRRNKLDVEESYDSASSRSKPQNALAERVAAKGEEHGCQNETAWRKLETEGTWDKNYKTKLLEEIYNHDTKQKEIKNIRILLIGPINSGKSSFLNTIASIDNRRITQVTVAGGSGTSLSRKLKVFRPQGRLKNFRLLDTMGIEDRELNGFNIRDLLFVVKGHVPPDYRFNPASPIYEDGKDFKKDPKSKDKVHCVVFVVDANVVGQENIPDATRKKVIDLQDELVNIDIPRIVLLTKIDVLCEMTETDITACYRSEAIKNAVDLAEDLFKVPKQNIFPVQNYSDEMDMDAKKDILPLLALRTMVFFGTDFLRYITAAESDEDSS